MRKETGARIYRRATCRLCGADDLDLVLQLMPAPDKLRFIRVGQPLVDEAERLAALPEPGTVRRRVQVDLPPGDHELVATQGELQVVNTLTIPRRS